MQNLNQNRPHFVRNNQQRPNNHVQRQNSVINPIQANQQGFYLEEVSKFAAYVKFQQLAPKDLTIKDAIEIITVADRLQIARLDALKSWYVDKGKVVISAHFILNVLINHLLLTNNVKIEHYNAEEPFCLVYLNDREQFSTSIQAWHKERTNTAIWKNNPTYAVEELALVRFLRNLFPTLMMGIISPVEVPPSFVSRLTALSVILGKGIYQKAKSFISSCFTSNNIVKAKPVKEEKLKNTDKLVENDVNDKNDDEDLFLDLDDLEIRNLQKVKPITHFNRLN